MTDQKGWERGTEGEASVDRLIRDALFPGAAGEARWYSAFMDVTWGVVEAMRERGWEFQFEWDHPETLCAVATFWTVTAMGVMQYTAEGPTPSLTICQAALGALNNPEPREHR